MTNHPNHSKQQQAKHTPGPYCFGGWSSNGTPILANGDDHAFIVATVNSPPYGHGHRVETAEQSVAEGKATTKLFAAAPETAAERDRLRALNAELLAALKRLVAAADKSSCDSLSVDNARAAIAKAEGL